MLFFKKRNKQNNEVLDESFKRVIEEINNLDDRDNPRKIEHYILESCEHIISVAKDIDTNKSLYVMLSDQLSDVEKIIRMPKQKKENLADLADNVFRLTKRKQNYKESDRRLSDEEFLMIQEHEESIVDDIKRMEENEKYKSKLESDIKYLEAEKSHCEIEKDYLSDNLNKLRISSLAILFVIIAIVCAWLVLPFNLNSGIRFAFITAIFIGVLAAFVILLIVGKQRTQYRKNIKQLNHNINLLNIERMRYVNITKALDYEMGVYDVRSSGELSYLWEQYILAVKELEAYRKNNIDLTFYLDRLYKTLKEMDLKFERKWVEQVALIIDDDKMLSLKNRLLERRNDTYKQIEEKTKLVKEERTEIDRLMKEHNFYVGEVLEIISSVDKVLGKINSTISTTESFNFA